MAITNRIIAATATKKPKKGSNEWYTQQQRIGGDIGSAVANKRKDELKKLLEEGKYYDLQLYGTVGKPPPGVKSGDAAFFFGGDWRTGKVVFPAVICKRPDNSKRVVSQGTCG